MPTGSDEEEASMSEVRIAGGSARQDCLSGEDPRTSVAVPRACNAARLSTIPRRPLNLVIEWIDPPQNSRELSKCSQSNRIV